MIITGNFKRRSGDPKPHQIQVILGLELVSAVDTQATAWQVDRTECLRKLWQSVIDAPDAEVSPVGVNGPEKLVSVSITAEMFEIIEKARMDIPRGSFFRSLTMAGIKLAEAGEK